jgi:hypothetical protein
MRKTSKMSGQWMMAERIAPLIDGRYGTARYGTVFVCKSARQYLRRFSSTFSFLGGGVAIVVVLIKQLIVTLLM